MAMIEGMIRAIEGGEDADPPPRLKPGAGAVRLPAVGVGSPAPFERSWPWGLADKADSPAG